MAKCEFKNGIIKSISGTIEKRTYITKDGKHSVCTVGRVINGKQHIYLREYKPRKTPLSPAEIQARKRFAVVQIQIAQMPKEQKEQYEQEFKRTSGKFRGKSYKTLRGFIAAHLYDQTAD